jgi:hypothetical protein
MEATGGCAMPSRTKLWLDCVSESTRVGKASLPSGNTRPIATGMCSGPSSSGDAGFAQAPFIGGRRQCLGQRQRVAFGGGVIGTLGLQARRAGAGVPAAELGQVRTRRILHGGDEVLAGHGLAVVAREVEVHALAEVVAADQGLDHADHLGALFVHRGGVEIVDLGVGGGADRVRHRPGILGELGDAQGAHFLDARHGARVQVLAEFLVAVDGEAFLERKLEPVATGDAIAGPVVEVLVGDDAVDALVIGVGGGVGRASTYLVLKMLRPLFSIAPMLKSPTATIM